MFFPRSGENVGENIQILNISLQFNEVCTVGGIHIQHDAPGRDAVALDISIHQHLRHPPQGPAVHPVLQAAQGGGGAEVLALRAPLGGHLQGRILPDLVVIIEVLIPQVDPKNPLRQKRPLLVGGVVLVPGVLDRLVQRMASPNYEKPV